MRKIKILYWCVVVWIALFIFSFLTNLYLTFITDFLNFGEQYYEKFVFGYYTQFIGVALSVVTFAALFFLKKGLSVTIKKGFFNHHSSNKFKIAGRLFFISGSLSLFWDVFLLFYSNGETFFEGISSDILLVFIGFGIFIIVDFIDNGYKLQQENDLTI